MIRVLTFLIASSLIAGSSDPPEWTQPFPPHKIMGNLYYVGSKSLASYLVATPSGLILINSSLEASVPLLEHSISQLGFRFDDVKILLISHAHYDHCGGSKAIKDRTHARYMVMDADVPAIEDGGRSDFQFGRKPEDWYPPTKVDRVLHDGDTVALGGAVLTAHLTPGHTKGCTTWTMKLSDGGTSYDAVIVGSPNVLSVYKLVNNPAYPKIAEDYQKGFRVLAALHCDIFLGSHGSYYDMEAKYARLGKGRVNPFLDGDGYRAYVADREKDFVAELAKQRGLSR